jgi:hypothetical protein
MKRVVNQSKFCRSSLSRLTVAVLGGGVLLLAAVRPALAQTAPLSGGGSDRSFNQSDDLPDMFNLLHQLQRGQIRSPYEFQQEQQQNITNEAADFREQRRRALEQQSQPGTVETSPADSSEFN